MKSWSNLIIFLIVFLSVSKNIYGEINQPSQNPPQTDKSPSSVPLTYAECVTINTSVSAREGINLKCGIWIYEKDDAKRYTQCLKAGGESFAFTDDSLDLKEDSSSHNICRMTFYNPHYEFPKNFVECEKKQKGAILGGDGSMENGVVRRKTCLIGIGLAEEVINKDVAKRLIQECTALGGDTSGNIPGCIIKFAEP